ncbi:MAG: hypothetical protein K5660_00275, partial [Paludibacteraceae bacterium]|nr:hypothetical protein [Paludibacteraceae bacterium]
SSLPSERERIASEIGARVIHIDTKEDECIKRLIKNPEGRNIDEWKGYISEYFRKEKLYGLYT